VDFPLLPPCSNGSLKKKESHPLKLLASWTMSWMQSSIEHEVCTQIIATTSPEVFSRRCIHMSLDLADKSMVVNSFMGALSGRYHRQDWNGKWRFCWRKGHSDLQIKMELTVASTSQSVLHLHYAYLHIRPWSPNARW
jgi:hypothetical protein